MFVYGTLRTSGVATHMVPGLVMYSCVGKFPYAVPATGVSVESLQDISASRGAGAGNRIYGNVVSVTDELLERFDFYEGVVSGMYVRRSVKAYTIEKEDDFVDAYIYLARPLLTHERVTGGDWVKYTLYKE